MFGRFLSLVTVSAVIILLLVLQSTNPNTSGPGGILAVFFLAYIIFLGVVTALLRGGTWLISQLVQPVARKPIEPLTVRHAYYLSSIIAAAPVMVIGMSSVGQLEVGEVGLVILFVILGVFYIQKRM